MLKDQINILFIDHRNERRKKNTKNFSSLNCSIYYDESEVLRRYPSGASLDDDELIESDIIFDLCLIHPNGVERKRYSKLQDKINFTIGYSGYGNSDPRYKKDNIFNNPIIFNRVVTSESPITGNEAKLVLEWFVNKAEVKQPDFLCKHGPTPIEILNELLDYITLQKVESSLTDYYLDRVELGEFIKLDEQIKGGFNLKEAICYLSKKEKPLVIPEDVALANAVKENVLEQLNY